MSFRHTLKQIWNLFFLLILFSFVTAQSVMDVNSRLEQVRAYTRLDEFDFWNWTLDAVWHKFVQESINLPAYLDEDAEKKVVIHTTDLTGKIQYLEWQILQNYTNPEIADPHSENLPLETQLEKFRQEASSLTALTETIIQRQVSQVLAEEHLAFWGQIIPPVEYEASPLPKALIVSPREVIHQDVNLSLIPELDLDRILTIEDEIAGDLNVSTLITNIGGIGTYPTMVGQTSDLTWLIGVVCHEWTHNYLTLRPLGINYGTNNELRTMNETTASIAEEELKWAVIQRFYPERMPAPVADETGQETPAEDESAAPVFNFDYEMYLTRTHVDELLAQNKVDEAESYMEERRQFFYQKGYSIRKLNQAWFAFHAAYVNAPSTGEEGQTGAAGQDPVGPAVWKLREQNPDLASFLNQISWMNSFEDLQQSLLATP